MMDFVWQDNGLVLTLKGSVISLDPINRTGTGQVKLFSKYIEGLEASSNDLLSFNTPGEYEVENSLITGFDAGNDSTIYVISSYGMSTLLLNQDISDNVMSRIGSVDIVFIDLNKLTDIDSLSKTITALESKVVICVGDDSQFSNIEKEVGLSGEKSQRVKLQKKDLPESGELLYHLH